jgi:hypothetical protein
VLIGKTDRIKISSYLNPRIPKNRKADIERELTEVEKEIAK